MVHTVRQPAHIATRTPLVILGSLIGLVALFAVVLVTADVVKQLHYMSSELGQVGARLSALDSMNKKLDKLDTMQAQLAKMDAHLVMVNAGLKQTNSALGSM